MQLPKWVNEFETKVLFETGPASADFQECRGLVVQACAHYRVLFVKYRELDFRMKGLEK